MQAHARNISLQLRIEELEESLVEQEQAVLISEAIKMRQVYADVLLSVARCMRIMSRRKWERLRRYLSYDYDSGINKYVRKTIGDVPVPELPPHTQLRNFAQLRKVDL